MTTSNSFNISLALIGYNTLVMLFAYRGSFCHDLVDNKSDIPNLQMIAT